MEQPHQDFYAILGVDDKASQDEIKRAYRKCARECHPDINRNDPQSTERMKRVNEAFETLRDPQKRFVYDSAKSAKIGMGAFEGMDWKMLAELLEKLVASIPKFKRKATEATKKETLNKNIPSTINVDLVVTMDEICRSDPPVKKLTVKVIRFKNGKRFVQRSNIYISLLNYQDIYIFHGEGDEILPGTFGDICVKLVITPHEHFHIDNTLSPYDIHYERSVTLKDYFYGLIETVSHIDGESTFEVSYVGGRKAQVVKGLGVHYIDETTGKRKRGDLYVMFDLQLPNPSIIHSNALDVDVIKKVIECLSI